MDDRIKDALMKNETEFLSQVDAKYRFSDGTGLIHWASMYDNRDMLGKVMAGNVNLQGGSLGSTPLYYALYNSQYRTMWMLLENGADPGYINRTGLGLLHTCVRFDDVLAFLLLLSYGADIQARDRRGRSVLEYAESRKSRRILSCIGRKHSGGYALFLCLALMHWGFLALSYWCKICAILLLLPFWLRIVATRFPLYLNIFYSCKLSYNAFIENRELVFTAWSYFLSLTPLLLARPRHLRQKTFVDAGGVIRDLAGTDRYNTRTFCYTCLSEKPAGAHHCSVCDRCILDFSHHCPCLNKCVDHGMQRAFSSYLIHVLGYAVCLPLGTSLGREAEVLAILVFLCIILLSGIIHRCANRGLRLL
jgi:palmitoyltransferase ZDHHC13/17